ncbi:MAG: dihydropteroate synthase [Candidatus Hodarchaeota archaeon]
MGTKRIEIKINNLRIGDDHPVRIMGVLNLSKESFYKGSIVNPSNICKKAEDMIGNGADFLDIGGRSTAPKSPVISISEEKQRVTESLKEIFSGMDDIETLISIDTQYKEVAEAAFDVFEANGKEHLFILNDVCGLKKDENIATWLKDVERPVILMASHNVPGDSLGIEETLYDLKESLSILEGTGYNTYNNVIIDPAIGKWIPEKVPSYDLEVLRNLASFSRLGFPILVAISRKSFIGAILEEGDPAFRFQGTLSATAISIFNGAHIIRTHDVNKETIDTIKVATAIRSIKII